jgi:hypothetical protein
MKSKPMLLSANKLMSVFFFAIVSYLLLNFQDLTQSNPNTSLRIKRKLLIYERPKGAEDSNTSHLRG